MNIDTKRNITKMQKSIETELSHLIAFNRLCSSQDAFHSITTQQRF